MDQIDDSTPGKAAFREEISSYDRIATLWEVLKTNEAILGDPRRGRAKFLELVEQHVGSIRRFARDAGLGARVEEKIVPTLRLVDASPSIFLVPWILRRLSPEVNENAILVAAGVTGSGKSYSSAALAFMIAEGTGVPFCPGPQTIENKMINIVFDIKDVLQLVYHSDPPLPRGSIIIFDDAGANANARDWRTQANTILAKMAQTFRYRGIFLILTVPDISFIDVQVRKSVHLKLVSVVNDAGENEKGTFRIEVNTQDEEGNIEFEPPRLSQKDFGDLPFHIVVDNIELESFHFPMPPQWFIDPYERKKDNHLSRLVTKLEGDMIVDEQIEDMRRQLSYQRLIEKTAKEASDEIERVLEMHYSGESERDIEDILKMPHSTVHDLIVRNCRVERCPKGGHKTGNSKPVKDKAGG